MTWRFHTDTLVTHKPMEAPQADMSTKALCLSVIPSNWCYSDMFTASNRGGKTEPLWHVATTTDQAWAALTSDPFSPQPGMKEQTQKTEGVIGVPPSTPPNSDR